MWRFRVVAITTLLAVTALAAGPTKPPGWKELHDKRDRCQAFIPSDWKSIDEAGSAEDGSHSAGIYMNSDQTWNRAKQEIEADQPQEYVENSVSRIVARVPEDAGVHYKVAARGPDFVCTASVDVKMTADVKRFGATARQIAQTVGVK